MKTNVVFEANTVATIEVGERRQGAGRSTAGERDAARLRTPKCWRRRVEVDVHVPIVRLIDSAAVQLQHYTYFSAHTHNFFTWANAMMTMTRGQLSNQGFEAIAKEREKTDPFALHPVDDGLEVGIVAVENHHVVQTSLDLPFHPIFRCKS